MKILIIGGYGTVGSAATAALRDGHDITIAGRSKGDIQVDITDPASIKDMYEATGLSDAVIVAAGGSHFGPVEEMNHDDVMKGVNSKMMGQINTVLIGQHYIKPGGSFTLTTGILSDDPVDGSIVSCIVNNGIHGFVMSSAPELARRNLRINVVSPGLVENSVERLGKLFPGYNHIPMASVGQAYYKAVLGNKTGEIITIY